MILVGIDPSINGTGFTAIECDENYNQLSLFFLGFSKVKKLEMHLENQHIVLLDKSYGDYPYHARGEIIYNHFKKYFPKWNEVNYVAIEDYAMGATGRVFDIGEMVGSIKQELWKQNVSYKKYPPSVVKQFATGKGNSDKVFMGKAFSDLQKPFIEGLNDYESPKADLVDSFWMAQLLRFELCYRNNKTFPKDLFQETNQYSIDAILGGKKKTKTLPAIGHEFITNKI